MTILFSLLITFMLMFSKSLSPYLIPPLPHISISSGLWPFPPGWLYHKHFKLIIFKNAILLPPKSLCLSYIANLNWPLWSQAPKLEMRRPLLTSFAPHLKSLIQSYQLCFLNISPSKLLLQILSLSLNIQYFPYLFLPPVQCPFQSTLHTGAKGIFLRCTSDMWFLNQVFPVISPCLQGKETPPQSFTSPSILASALSAHSHIPQALNLPQCLPMNFLNLQSYFTLPIPA